MSRHEPDEYHHQADQPTGVLGTKNTIRGMGLLDGVAVENRHDLTREIGSKCKTGKEDGYQYRPDDMHNVSS